MCSKDCLAKMKVLCLNTVQLLFQDAFDKFLDNLSNQNHLINSLGSEPKQSKEKIELKNFCNFDKELLSECSEANFPKYCKKTIESIDNQGSISKEFNHQKATTSYDLNNNQSYLIENQSDVLANQQKLNQSIDKSLSQVVLCNLMQNLVKVINEQCLKQLPSQQQEKKKRKRKRKRKRVKLLNDSNENEILCAKSCEAERKQETCSLVKEQINQTKYFTDEQFKLMDKIKETMENTYLNKPNDEMKKIIQHNYLKNVEQYRSSINKNDHHFKNCKNRSFSNGEFISKIKLDEYSNAQCTSTNLNGNSRHLMFKNDDFKNKKTEILKDRISSSSTSNSPNSSNKKNYQFKYGEERFLKRKRDDSSIQKDKTDDLQDYKERRRITSARKPPTLYKRGCLSSPSENSSPTSLETTYSSSEDKFAK